jgi:hypothetical protein
MLNVPFLLFKVKLSLRENSSEVRVLACHAKSRGFNPRFSRLITLNEKIVHKLQLYLLFKNNNERELLP